MLGENSLQSFLTIRIGPSPHLSWAGPMSGRTPLVYPADGALAELARRLSLVSFLQLSLAVQARI